MAQLWGARQVTAAAVAFGHLYAAYGLAFVLSSLFLWIRDAFVIQQVISFVIIPVLSGAGFPIAMLPGWLQTVALRIPFTWAFELERPGVSEGNAVERGPGELPDTSGNLDPIVVPGLSALRCDPATLRHARRRGNLGLY